MTSQQIAKRSETVGACTTAHHYSLRSGILDGTSRGLGARQRRDLHAVGAQAANEVAPDEARAARHERAAQRRGCRFRHGLAARRGRPDEAAEAPHLASHHLASPSKGS